MRKLLIVLVLFLAGCANDGIQVVQTDNMSITATKLMTIEGCSVYRFYDAGHWIYTTICPSGRSQTSWDERRQAGKTNYTERRTVDTVRD